MRYLCPICRVKIEMHHNDLCGSYWSILCVDCLVAFGPRTDRVSPPFQWKRRAMGVRFRARMMRRDQLSQSGEWPTSFIGAMEAPLSRGMTSMIEGKTSYTDAVRTMINDLRAQLLPTVLMDFAQRLQDAANGVIREQWSNSSRNT